MPLLPLLPLGISLASSLISRRKRAPTAAAPTGEEAMYRNRFQQALAGMQGPDAYEMEMANFDPAAGFAEQTQAELADQDDIFARRYADQLGGMVGAGRLPTKSGFGLMDAQETVRQGQRERAGIQQRNAAAAGQARGNWLTNRAYYAGDRKNRYFDAIGGRLNTLEAQRLQDEADKRRGRAGLLGGALSAGGQILGGYLAGRR